MINAPRVLRKIGQKEFKPLKDIFTWEKRNVSIVGKIYIIKKNWYLNLCTLWKLLLYPIICWQTLTGCCLDFCGEKKTASEKDFEKVKRIVMYNDFGNGGLKMIDLKQIQVSLLLHWVVRLCRAQTWEKWAWTPKILYMFFGSRYECFYSNVDIMFTVGCSFKGLDEMKSYFWQAVLKKWIDNNRVDCTSSGCTLLWNNRNVTCQGKVYFKDWITAGIMNVADMMTPEGIASYTSNAGVIFIWGVSLTYPVLASFLSR